MVVVYALHFTLDSALFARIGACNLSSSAKWQGMAEEVKEAAEADRQNQTLLKWKHLLT